MTIDFKSLVIHEEVVGIAQTNPGQFALNTANHSYIIDLPDETLTVRDIQAFCNLHTSDWITSIPFAINLTDVYGEGINFRAFTEDATNGVRLSNTRSWFIQSDNIGITGYLEIQPPPYTEHKLNSKEKISKIIFNIIDFFAKKHFLCDMYQSRFGRSNVHVKLFKLGESIPYSHLEGLRTNSEEVNQDMTIEDLFETLSSYFKVYDLLNLDREPRAEVDGMSKLFHKILMEEVNMRERLKSNDHPHIFRQD